MRLHHLLFALIALVIQDHASEGKRWWRHVEFLASDALEGRNVGTPGFEKAVAYVEAEFKTIGLKPAGPDGYRQPVNLESRVLVPERSKLALVRNGAEEPLTLRDDATLSARGELNGSIEASMVFVGYGLSIPEANWNDLDGLDLRGKIAVYLNAPAPAAVSDNVRSHVSSAGERWAVLKKAGAIGIATIAGPPPVTRTGNAAPAASAAPAAVAQPAQPTVTLADPELQEQTGQIVSLSISRSAVDKFLAGSGHTLAELDALVTDKKPLPRFPLDATLRAEAAVGREPVQSYNVVGIYEGSDARLKNEFVVMSAHLDHVGIGRAINGDSLYNGAMDDASGVASMIEIARLLKESNARPRRSILFIAVTAEEKGLLGSKVLRRTSHGSLRKHRRQHQPRHVPSALSAEGDRGAGAGRVVVGRIGSRGRQGSWASTCRRIASRIRTDSSAATSPASSVAAFRRWPSSSDTNSDRMKRKFASPGCATCTTSRTMT